ncbi:MAG: flagellar basal body P-ring formation protein FlgA [Chitinivibrionales bacterium]|nr:flagellar basal body P-ring formation protein FlgA [Chitinivibrionales bacterium]MBD3395991.1 flagellar basal body P-ring formation protein FlgA [Chitinivibrionales bacterium]
MECRSNGVMSKTTVARRKGAVPGGRGRGEDGTLLCPTLQHPITPSLLCLILFLPASVFARPGMRVVFHESASVLGTSIVLGDVAEVQGGTPGQRKALAGTWIGHAAPPGSSRLLNTRDAVRYALAEARSNLDIVPSGPERIRISTKSRRYQLIDYKDDIMHYLSNNVRWAKGTYQVTLVDSTLSWHGLDRPAQISFEGLDTQYPRGSVRLSVCMMQGDRMRKMHFNCFIRVTAPVVVSRRVINRGETVGRDAVELVERDITRLRYQHYSDANDVRGMLAMRTIPEGTILHGRMIEHEPVVRKGDLVYIRANKGAITVSVPARAREDGAVGSRIWVENTNSHKIIRVEIVGKGKAIIPSQEAI